MNTPERVPAAAHACWSIAGSEKARCKALSSGPVALLFVLLAGLGGSSLGCAAEEKKPQTVAEWMEQPRVGESSR